jgi:hypothetical protein
VAAPSSSDTDAETAATTPTPANAPPPPENRAAEHRPDAGGPSDAEPAAGVDRLALITAANPPEADREARGPAPLPDEPAAGRPAEPAAGENGGDARNGTAVAALPPDAPDAAGGPEVLSADEAAQLLLGAPEQTSARAAVEALLRRWNVRSLAERETGDRIYLDAVADGRALHHLQVSGSLSMLHVLNLPAILELIVPGARGPRYVLFTGTGEHGYALTVGEREVRVERRFLDEYWLGHADLFWRDFEDLGATLGKGSTGPAVTRLQRLLARLGVYAGPLTGVFGDDTEAAVVTFQRRRRLFADGRVGQLTRIALYDAVPGYAQPRLLDEAQQRAGGA